MGGALGFFTLLAAISLYSGIVGQRSCGWFGQYPINPWWVFAFDITVVASFLAFRPARRADLASALLQ